MKKLRKYELLILIGLIIAFFLYLINYYDIFSLNSLRDFIVSFGIFSPLIFVLLFILLGLLGFPISILYAASGILFGMYYGYITSIVSAITTGSLAFFISRHFIKFHPHRFKKNKKNLTEKLIEKIGESAKYHGFRNILFLRLYFLPYIELSYSAGLVRELKSRDFILATLTVNFIEAFIFIFLGVAILDNLYLLFIAITLIVIFISIPRFFKFKHFNHHKNKE